jgi:hypothetical protein
MATYNMKAKIAACVPTINFCDRGKFLTLFHLIVSNLSVELLPECFKAVRSNSD